MTLNELKNTVMFQTNNDADDVGDFMPSLHDYLNDGYDRLLNAYSKHYLGDDGFPKLLGGGDEPLIPAFAHSAIADWATWLIYRNGNPQKQQRGFQFRTAFDEVRRRLASTPASGKKVEHFINIPE